MNYAKAVGAVVATVLSALVAAWSGGVTPAEWINVAILGAGAAGVFAAPNVSGAKYTKAILAVITAMLTLAVSLIVDGLSTSDVMQLVVAGLGALGIYAVPNVPPEPPVLTP